MNLDDETIVIGQLVALDATDQFGSLAGKHRSEYDLQFEFRALLTLYYTK